MMKPYILEPSETTPMIELNPGKNIFIIEGSSRPEDVHSFYYSILDWFQLFKEKIETGKIPKYTQDNPLIFNSRLVYFNSSSAKFLYDIFMEFRNIQDMNMTVQVNWHYDEDDEDMHDAGIEMAELVEMPFNFISQ